MGSEQKERILSQAERKLLEGGSSFSVDELTSVLGMSKKTFYQNFPTKEAMLEELVGRVFGEVGRGIDAIVQGQGTFVEKIDSLMQFMGSVFRRLAVPFSGEMDRRSPRIWELIENFRQQKIQENFARLLEQGRREGSVREDVDTRIFLMAYSAAIRAIVRPSVLASHAFTIPDVLEQIVRIFFSGLMTGSGRAAFDEIHRQQSQLR
jgi:AcrR family transcriptional regulator